MRRLFVLLSATRRSGHPACWILSHVRWTIGYQLPIDQCRLTVSKGVWVSYRTGEAGELYISFSKVLPLSICKANKKKSNKKQKRRKKKKREIFFSDIVTTYRSQSNQTHIRLLPLSKSPRKTTNLRNLQEENRPQAAEDEKRIHTRDWKHCIVHLGHL